MDALHLSIKENSLYWRTRAKIRFALEGDENTKFFHTSATYRLHRNSIPFLSIDGVDTTDHQGKASILQSYYSSLLGSVTPTVWRFDISSHYPNNYVLPGGVTAPFTPEEVKTAFISMNKQSSLGPDGFGPYFFGTFWATVSQDILEVFSSFFDGSIDLTRINRALLVLLPKIDAAVHPSQFRPISLQNCIMKAITKVLTTRLQAAIHSLVDTDQTGFLSGRDFGEPSPSPSFLGRIFEECLPLYRSITRVTVVDGSTTSFWLDKWLPGEPLATRFPALFSHSTRRHASVALVVSQGLDLQDRLTRAAEAELLIIRCFIDTTVLQEG
ncbi:hypothetical protein QYE76_035002 [Lolium multiflorum]|uniref:Reverse transcriptase domain-containing protein n=1 Tax=Lolium multiflorum TaxID=4521 RepID=A0AAD8VLR9_LOLMU|nr:hypothetical protein QYE76_035002 [Lolium multiflorum]